MRADLLKRTPSSATCIAGNEVVLDYLDEGQFERLCGDLGGDDVDGVSRLPEFPGGVTIDEIERYGDIREKREQRSAARGATPLTGTTTHPGPARPGGSTRPPLAPALSVRERFQRPEADSASRATPRSTSR